ncbi:hypothetical protein EMIHUDRAFT_43649, partial [Emiliania huxleyi CCMP1516]|uniref:non-specific serine/threonine protein kinase n=2 Tax=Emiliania huxleyi TaxID=2903 RepID=A0A0D3I065_EMIH1
LATPSPFQLICSAHDASCLYLVMRAYLGGNLANLLAAHGPLTENSARFYLANIALGLELLHVLGVMYRDLKPENVLLGSSGWPVLADFGLIAFVDSSANASRSYTRVGTPLFMAPEMVAETGHGAEVDWWAMGVLACDCLTGHTPFAEDDDEAALYRNIATATFARRFQREFACRLGPGAPLVDALLKLEPSERLGAGTGGVGALRACPFFRGVPWEALRRRQVAAP